MNTRITDRNEQRGALLRSIARLLAATDKFLESDRNNKDAWKEQLQRLDRLTVLTKGYALSQRSRRDQRSDEIDRIATKIAAELGTPYLAVWDMLTEAMDTYLR
jgi:exonuclease VII large subunit